MSHTTEPAYEGVATRLASEFSGVHNGETVSHRLAAAQHGAHEVTGKATPDLVKRIARKHLQVLARVTRERRQRITLRQHT